jgi:hypothetical protein
MGNVCKAENAGVEARVRLESLNGTPEGDALIRIKN